MPGIIPDKAKLLKWFWITLVPLPFLVLAFLTPNSSGKHTDPLTPKERAWVKTHETIRFAPDPGFPPIEYFDEAGQYTGITADYLALMKKRLGIRFKIIRTRNWKEISTLAEKGKIDLFSAAQTPLRSKHYMFTSPYLKIPAVIITRKNVEKQVSPENLKGKKVAVVSGYAVEEFIAEQYPEIVLDPLPDALTALKKVSLGEDDALVENLATAVYYIEREGIANLRITGDSGYSYAMTFASRGDIPILNRIMEKGLAQIIPTEKGKIFRKWVPYEPKPPLASKRTRTILLLSLSVIALLTTGVIVWNRALRRQVRARTRELERELQERQRIEENLRESEEKFRILAETFPVGVSLYQGERIMYVNAATERLFGYSEEECLRMNFWEWVHEDFQETVKNYGLRRQRGEKAPANYECKHVTKSGEEKWISVSASRLEFRGKPAGVVSLFDISHSKRAEESLRESEKKFRVLTETSPTAICLIQGEYHVYVNAAMKRLTKYSEQELLEMKFWNWIHEDFREISRKRGLATQEKNSRNLGMELKCVTREGEVRWLLVSGGRIEYGGKPGGVVSLFDITERKQTEDLLCRLNEDLEKRVLERTADLERLNGELIQEIATRMQVEEELRESKDRIQAIVDAFEGMIYICSKDYRIKFMNRGFIVQTGCDLPGEFCYKALHHRDSVCPWCSAEEVFTGKTVYRELHDPKTGRWAYAVDVPLFHTDGSISRQTMVTDITELKRVEERLRQNQEQLEDLNRTLEQRVREEVAKNREKDIILIQQNRQAALGETLDHIAHQWKQPLNALSLITGGMQEDASTGELTDERLYESTERILDLVEHMAQTINIFRDFYRPEKERSIFSIKEAIDKAISFIEPALKFETVEITRQADCELSAMGYQKEYAQVILNILSNAREAFRERATERPEISIRAYEEKGKAVVSITDNAGGIADEHMEKIFELYFTTRKSSGGTGVGLYLSKNIIEKNMGGTLSVRNSACGAQFLIELDMPQH